MFGQCRRRSDYDDCVACPAPEDKLSDTELLSKVLKLAAKKNLPKDFCEQYKLEKPNIQLSDDDVSHQAKKLLLTEAMENKWCSDEAAILLKFITVNSVADKKLETRFKERIQFYQDGLIHLDHLSSLPGPMTSLGQLNSSKIETNKSNSATRHLWYVQTQKGAPVLDPTEISEGKNQIIERVDNWKKILFSPQLVSDPIFIVKSPTKKYGSKLTVFKEKIESKEMLFKHMPFTLIKNGALEQKLSHFFPLTEIEESTYFKDYTYFGVSLEDGRLGILRIKNNEKSNPCLLFCIPIVEEDVQDKKIALKNKPQNSFLGKIEFQGILYRKSSKKPQGKKCLGLTNRRAQEYAAKELMDNISDATNNAKWRLSEFPDLLPDITKHKSGIQGGQNGVKLLSHVVFRREDKKTPACLTQARQLSLDDYSSLPSRLKDKIGYTTLFLDYSKGHYATPYIYVGNVFFLLPYYKGGQVIVGLKNLNRDNEKLDLYSTSIEEFFIKYKECNEVIDFFYDSSEQGWLTMSEDDLAEYLKKNAKEFSLINPKSFPQKNPHKIEDFQSIGVAGTCHFCRPDYSPRFEKEDKSQAEVQVHQPINFRQKKTNSQNFHFLKKH